MTSGSSLANVEILYEFHGKSAHAALAPYLGRSALDAVELMDIGANYLREHLVPGTSIHYAILDTGGAYPNVVQEHASVLYMIRTPKYSELANITERLNHVAQGAALMTETTYEYTIRKETAELVPNHYLEGILQRNMEQMLPPKADAEEYAEAECFRKTMEEKYNTMDEMKERCEDYDTGRMLAEHRNDVIYDFLLPLMPSDKAVPYSTDVGNVSHICPTAQIVTATWTANTMQHTWQAIAQGKSSLAHKGMLYAAAILAAAAIDCFADKEKIKILS